MSPGLFLHVLGLEARTRMSYRVDFWLRTLFALVAELGAYVFLAWALFAEAGTETLRGFTQGELVGYYLAVMLLGKLVLGGEDANYLADDIYQGGLNRYLVFPVAYFPFKYAQRLGAQLPTAVQVLVFGLGLLLLTSPGQAVRPGAGDVARTLAAVGLGNLLFFLLRSGLELFAFWQDNVWSLVVLLRNCTRLAGGAMVPLALFPGWAQDLLGWLPFRFVYDFPVRCFLGRLAPGEFAAGMGAGLAWCLAVSLATAAVWRRGQLRYSGVGI